MYFEYIPDDVFLGCIKEVVQEYTRPVKKSSTIDDITKTMFDRHVIGSNALEKFRLYVLKNQRINMALGRMHQKLIGHLAECEDLGVGHVSKMDVYCQKLKAYIEIKNRSNTMNSDSKNSVIQKCKALVESQKADICYICMMHLERNHGDLDVPLQKHSDTRIRLVSGKKMYEILTGDPDAWMKLHNAIDRALQTVCKDIIKVNVNEIAEGVKDIKI